MKKSKTRAVDPAKQAWADGCALLETHPLLRPLYRKVGISLSQEWPFENGWCRTTTGARPWGRYLTIVCNGRRRGSPEEWAYAIAHGLLHVGLRHLRPFVDEAAWVAAADAEVERLMRNLGLGKRPAEICGNPTAGGGSGALEMARFALKNGIPPDWTECGTNGSRPDFDLCAIEDQDEYAALLSLGIRDAFGASLRVAGGRQKSLSDQTSTVTPAREAWGWFLSSYPLLGSLVAAFRLRDDVAACQSLDISIAAVNESRREVFVNPAAALSLEEWKFVIAHEVMHVMLRHDARQGHRDPTYWNYACDFAINLWLQDLGIGYAPKRGLLIDESLRGLSAETIYDVLVRDVRRHRRLLTLRGKKGGCGVADDERDKFDDGNPHASLDDIVQSALRLGLDLHRRQGRGTLPAGLVEEIEAVLHPPPPWDVQLAQWGDAVIEEVEPSRSYARLSRRQSSSPDIPRPGKRERPDEDPARTFAVLLDTSGSMDRGLLARALGATAQLALSKRVPAVRLVFCDAEAIDEGWITPDELAGRVAVKGRGGTMLQAGVDCLDRLELPSETPLLIITDTLCDVLSIRRPHAFLVPEKLGLPFKPDGPVFRML